MCLTPKIAKDSFSISLCIFSGCFPLSAFYPHKVSFFADGIEEDQEKMIKTMERLGIQTFYSPSFPKNEQQPKNHLHHLKYHQICNNTLHSP